MSREFWAVIIEGGQRLYKNWIAGKQYIVVRDGAGATPWRAYSPHNNFDATFYTMREAQAAAVQNAEIPAHPQNEPTRDPAPWANPNDHRERGEVQWYIDGVPAVYAPRHARYDMGIDRKESAW